MAALQKFDKVTSSTEVYYLQDTDFDDEENADVTTHSFIFKSAETAIKISTGQVSHFFKSANEISHDLKKNYSANNV